MSYQATVFKVMIASPGDVAAERNVIREVITEWNNVNADARRTVSIASWMGNALRSGDGESTAGNNQ